MACGKFVPTAYALLPRKTGAIYDKVVHALVDYVGDVNHVEKFTCDFERGMHNAVEKHLPNAVVSVCYFHFSQAIFCKIGEHGCTPVYNNVAEFRELVSHIYGLAFVSRDNIVEVWNTFIVPEAKSKAKEHWTDENDPSNGYSGEVENFLKYVEKTWVGEQLRRGQRAPFYSHEIWNKWDSVTAEDTDLTNNGNEAYNSSWAPGVPKSASVWTVMDCFKKEESLARVTYREAVRGVKQAHNHSRDQKQMNKIRELSAVCKSFGTMTTKMYLEMVTGIMN